VVLLGALGNTYARRYAPFPPVQCRWTNAHGPVELIVPGDGEAIVLDRVKSCVIAVKSWIKVKEIAVFLGQRTIELVSRTCRDTDIGVDLPFVLNEASDIVRALIAVRGSLKEWGVAGVDLAFGELCEALEVNKSTVLPTVGDVQLGIGVIASDRKCVIPESGYECRCRLEAILENPSSTKSLAGPMLRLPVWPLEFEMLMPGNLL
jgi:hypothetical protein